MFGRESVRHHDQAAAWLVCLRGNDGFELGCVVNRSNDRLHSEGCSSGFKGVQPMFGIWRCCRVQQHRDPSDTRRNLFKKVQPLASHRGLHSDETGDVSSWFWKARDEAATNRIGNERENDGNATCLFQQLGGGGRALRKNEVGL